MIKILVLCLMVFGANSALRAQDHPASPPSEQELTAISARGRALAEYDAAAWHASDAVQPLAPTSSTVQLYIARKTENRWIVVWGRFNPERTKFLIAYEAFQGASLTEFTAVQHDPPLEDSDVYLRSAKAHELAASDFSKSPHPNRPYNVAVLPSESGGWYVYLIPAQTADEIIPYGADLRYTISADGETVTDKRQMHQRLLQTGSSNLQTVVHVHVLSGLPEDSDVFYAMSRKASHGDWIITARDVFAITAAGSINYLGTTLDVEKQLDAGKFGEIEEPYRTMARNLMENGDWPETLLAFASLAGARCEGKTPVLKFSIVLHNGGDEPLILTRRAVWNAQLRFGASDADLRSGKYEKIAVIAPERTDYSDAGAFLSLLPGMAYRGEREYPIAGVDLAGKSAVQLVFFTWPPQDASQANDQRARWAKAGKLFTETVETSPVPLKLDATSLRGCYPN